MGLRIAGDDDDDDVDDDNDDGVEVMLMMKLVEGVMEQLERFVSDIRGVVGIGDCCCCF